MEPQLTPVEARILACLVEKEATTPEYYPMTVNALVAACNQKSNRDPVMALDAGSVEPVLETLQHEKKLVALVRQAGARVPKYRQLLTEVITLDPPARAVLCELMLRGPQTQGELRTRAARIHPLRDLSEVQAGLEELRAWGGGPLVAQVPPRPRGREPRYAHLLCGEVPEAMPMAERPGPSPERQAPEPVEASPDRLAGVEAEVARLREDVDALRRDLDALRSPPDAE
jgi:uncharacterized protein YceH (UPF0502 family)